MTRPTKRGFYKHMENLYGEEFKKQEIRNQFYDKLLDTIQEANKDKLIYRNTMACCGVEYTPIQVNILISTIEYALEYVDT